jgi:oleandomycin transport system permease protein
MNDSLILARRTVTKMFRNPEQFLDVTLQPIIMTVLFVFIFGGAVAGNTDGYLPFVIPGIIVQTIMFTSLTIGVNLNTDIQKGVFDRFRSLPIARSAPHDSCRIDA